KATMAEFDAALDELIEKHTADRGASLRFLTQPSNSPSFKRLREAVVARFPEARFYSYASVNDANLREGARLAFGAPLAAVPDLAAAKVVLAIDSDFLGAETGAVRAARGFGQNRRIDSPRAEMSRLY